MLRRRRSSEADVGWWGGGGGRGIDVVDDTPSWTVSRCGSWRCCSATARLGVTTLVGTDGALMMMMMMVMMMVLRWCVMNLVVLDDRSMCSGSRMTPHPAVKIVVSFAPPFF
ncbi:uncharacterized protein LOC143913579 [Arctopsyche grandis]|uniref:uncharacterized protein LOC143913579 n=1 Tax=Arctopsyche grandis TaxID=121162 RepID=UPI00406D8A16